MRLMKLKFQITWFTLIMSVGLSSCALQPIDHSDAAETTTVTSRNIIDVHRHGSWPTGDDEAYRNQMLDEMNAHGVRLAVISLTDYDHIESWVDAAPERFLAGVMLGCPRNSAEPRYKCFPEDDGWVDISWLQSMVEAKKIRAIHEVLPNYYGISIGNPRYQPYFQIAEDNGLPVGVHTQPGPPPGARNSLRGDPDCCPDYDPKMGNPYLLRQVLDRHPRLKVWMQHVGAGQPGDYTPFWDETLALLRDYPQVYLDLSITNGPLPIELYEQTLRTLIDAGFADRIMMGTDNLPTALVLGRLASISWLTQDQRDGVLFKNAERFFGIH